METRLETITPEKARAYLEHNTDNRVLRQGWIEALAGMIQRGQWATTHQGIAFTAAGRLVDGQHRLHAVIRANEPIQIMVTRGLSDDDYPHIDGGAPRTNADRIKLLENVQQNKSAVALVRAYLLKAIGHARGYPSIDQIENCFLSMADAFTAVSAQFHKRIPSLTASDVGAAIACYIHKHPANGASFLHQYITGEGLSSGDPVLYLREAMIAGRISGQGSPGYWVTMAATKHHHAGNKMKRVDPASTDWMGNEYTSVRLARAARSRRAAASMTPEARSERSRKGHASLTPEQRSERSRKALAGVSPEERSRRARIAGSARGRANVRRWNKQADSFAARQNG